MEVHTIKPLDTVTISAAARETGAIVTAEEHSTVGGLGGAVAEALSGTHPVPIIRVGIDDRFATTGPYLDLLEYLGLTTSGVVEAAHRALALKAPMTRSGAADRDAGSPGVTADRARRTKTVARSATDR